MRKKELIVILNPDYDPEVEREIFTEAGYEFVSAQCDNDEETISAAKDAVGIINIYCNITENVANNLTKCKVIVRAGVGYDMIDVRACRTRGIEVCNVPDYCIEEVADHAVALLLTLQRKIHLHNNYTKKGIWNGELVGDIHRLNTQNLGIIGLGLIGRRFANKMKGFTQRIFAFDPYMPDDYFVKEKIIRLDLEDIFLQSDIISFHCPLTPDTYHMLSKTVFEKITRKPIIVNVSRGALIDQLALINALKTGIVAGAALDVLDGEPNLPSEMLCFKNVIITPHIAWYSEEAETDLRTRSIEEVLRVIRGEPPKNPVP